MNDCRPLEAQRGIACQPDLVKAIGLESLQRYRSCRELQPRVRIGQSLEQVEVVRFTLKLAVLFQLPVLGERISILNEVREHYAGEGGQQTAECADHGRACPNPLGRSGIGIAERRHLFTEFLDLLPGLFNVEVRDLGQDC